MSKMERIHFYITCGEIDSPHRRELLSEYFSIFQRSPEIRYSVISNKDIHKYLDAVNNPDVPMSSRQFITDGVLNKENIGRTLKNHFNYSGKMVAYDEDDRINAIKMCLSRDIETSILGTRLCARHYLSFNLTGPIEELVSYDVFLKSLFYNISIKHNYSIEAKVVKEFCSAPYDFLKFQKDTIDKKYFNLYLELTKS